MAVEKKTPARAEKSEFWTRIFLTRLSDYGNKGHNAEEATRLAIDFANAAEIELTGVGRPPPKKSPEEEITFLQEQLAHAEDVQYRARNDKLTAQLSGMDKSPIVIALPKSGVIKLLGSYVSPYDDSDEKQSGDAHWDACPCCGEEHLGEVP